MEDKTFEHYTPQHPLPEEIRKMAHDDTVCQYCGVSYLIHTEIKKLEDKLKETEKELEHYKGKEDREAALKAENSQLLANKKALHEQLTSKENELSMLKQELKTSTETSTSLQSQLTAANASSDKYRQQYMAVLRKFSQLSTVARQQRETLTQMRDDVDKSRSSIVQQIETTRQTAAEMLAGITKEYVSLQSCLQCLEMEHIVTKQANKTLTDKLRGLEQRAENLLHCEQEMARLDVQNSQLQARQKELDKELEKAVSDTQNLNLQVDQYKHQLKHKVDEMEQLLKDRQSQAQKNDTTLKKLERELQQKEGELTAVQKQLKNLENKHREVERRQTDITHQNIMTANEAKDLKEALERTRADVEALKHEREVMIDAHQTRIEDLRESFKRKMSETERWPEKLQMSLAEEKHKHQAELSLLEQKMKENFVMELKIEKEKYDELLKKYQVQNNDRSSQKAVEMADLESKHQKVLHAMQQQLKDLKKNAEDREADLRSEIESLKRIIHDLQNKLGKFESQGEEKVKELMVELNDLRSQLGDSEEKRTALSKDLQQAQEEVHFLQNTVRSECEERFELTEALGEARRQLLALKMPSGGYSSAGSGIRVSQNLDSNGLAPLRTSVSVSSLQSGASSSRSDDSKPRAPVPTHPVNVSYKAVSLTPQQRHTDTVADTRRRISALLGRPS